MKLPPPQLADELAKASALMCVSFVESMHERTGLSKADIWGVVLGTAVAMHERDTNPANTLECLENIAGSIRSSMVAKTIHGTARMTQ